MQSKSNRRKTFAKPIILTAAVLCVIMLSAMAPKLLLEWKDRNKTGQFTPLQREIATLGGASDQNNLDRIYKASSATYTQTGLATERTEIESIFEQDILPIFLELEDADLLTGEITYYVAQVIEQPDCTITIQESDANGFLFRGYSIETVNSNNSIGIVVDVDSNHIMTLNIMSGGSEQDIFPDFDYEVVFNRYISWLGLDMVDDWEIMMQPSETITFYRAFSQQYGITADVDYYESVDAGFSYALYVRAL